MLLLLPAALHILTIAAISPPEIVEHPIDVVVARNEPVTLNCKVTGDPEPTVEWLKDGELVTTARDDPRSHRILLPDHGLFFLRAQQSKKEEDSGEYWCRATNSQGNVTSNRGHLQVAYIDREFQGLPSDVDVAVGSTVVISCKAPKGFPPPTIIWLKDGRVLSLNSVSRLEGGSLVIGSVSKSDHGQYQCKAENVAGVRESPTVTLGVHQPPHFTKKPEGVKVALVGGDLVLECEAGGDPQPRVSWSRAQGQINSAKLRMVSGGGIVLQNIHPSEEGIYQCLAENKIGRVTAQVQVTVKERPVLTVSPETSIQARAGEDIKLSCMATGRPTPNIFWGKEGVFSVLFPGMSVANVHVTGDGCLKIRDPDVENSGRYTCNVVNDVGAAMAASHVLVSDREGNNNTRSHLNIYKTSDSPMMEEARMILHQQKILELDSIRAVGVSSVEVWWKFLSSRAYCEGVVIQYRERNKRYDQFRTVTISSSHSQSTVINNLSPATEYDVFLQPYYATIVGLPTSIRHIKTRTEEIVRKTEILVAEMINVTTAFIVWQPKQPSYGITGYQVVLKNNKSSLSTTVDAGVSEVFLKLNPNDLAENFQVQVGPVSQSGPGDFSPPVNLSLPSSGLPISVQPNLAEVESTAWLLVLLVSLAIILLLLTSLTFYYRRRKAGSGSGYLPAAVNDIEYHSKARPGVLWSERHWEQADSEKNSTASNKKLLNTSPSLATEYSYAEQDSRQAHQMFESPYATSNLIYDTDRKIKGSATMHELQVTPLLMHKGSKSRHHKRLKRASQSFDESAEEFRRQPRIKQRAYRQRSNPNILDLIPPPPPLYGPPSLPHGLPQGLPQGLPPALHVNPCSSTRSSKSGRAGLRSQHIMERRDSDSSDYFIQGHTDCPVHSVDTRLSNDEMVEQVLRQELSNFHETVQHFG